MDNNDEINFSVIEKFTKEQLSNLDFVPKINKIELITLAEYYKEHLSNKSFKFKIKLKGSKDMFNIDIRFFDESMPHLLGIQKIVESTSLSNQKYKYQGADGFQGILNKDITISSLKELDKQLHPKKNKQQLNKEDKDPRVFPSIESRITHFHLIPQLLRDCSMIKFSSEIVTEYYGGNCNLRSDFILYSTKFKMKLQLGVVQEKGTIYHVPETFIVTPIRNRSADRLTGRQRFAEIIERYEPEIIFKDKI